MKPVSLYSIKRLLWDELKSCGRIVHLARVPGGTYKIVCNPENRYALFLRLDGRDHLHYLGSYATWASVLRYANQHFRRNLIPWLQLHSSGTP